MNVEYRTHMLDNGIQVVYIPRKDSNVSSICVFCRVGSVDENPSTYGMSHYLEHMLFKGTDTRPSAKIISSELDSVGAYFNAYTDKACTGYIVKVNSDFLEKSIYLLGDILSNSNLKQTEFDIEKHVVVEEINKSKDIPSVKVLENAYEIIFKEHPLAHTIASEPPNILSYNRSDVYSYYKKYYVSNNIIISVASNVIFEDIIKYIQKSDFNNCLQNKELNLRTFPPLLKQTIPRFSIKNKKTEQVHLVIGFPIESMYSRDKYALELIQTILAGNMSSRLFLDLREKNGLSYNVSMDTSYYQTCGAIFIQTSFNKDSLFIKNTSIKDSKMYIKDIITPGGLPIIIENLKLMKNILVPEDELEKAKGFLKGSFILGMEDGLSKADHFGRQLMFNHNPIENFGYLIDEYNKVTPEDIKRTSNKYFDFNKMNISIIGEYKLEDVEKFVSIYLDE